MEWISVKVRLPKVNFPVLFLYLYDDRFIESYGDRQDKGWIEYDEPSGHWDIPDLIKNEDVYFWMPYPIVPNISIIK